MKIKNPTLILPLLVLFSCVQENHHITPTIALTFDDTSIDSWFDNAKLFEKYNAKVTFFISGVDQLEQEKFDMLLELQEQGHEIACHTLTHPNAIEYIEKNGIINYLRNEIDSPLTILQNKGFNIASFAYPFGIYTDELSDSLAKRFTLQRGAIYNKTDWLNRKKRSLDKFEIFFTKPGCQIVSAMGIDFNFGNTMSLIAPAIDKCKTDSCAVVFYAHKIDTTNNSYSISPNKLDSILQYAVQANVRLGTFSDLIKNN